jgi:glutathione S-transferase
VPAPLLVTIAFSHFCEKARWALDHARIPHRESAHLPVFHVPAVRRAGGRRSTPALVTEDGVLADSSDILAWIDRRRPEIGLFGKTSAEQDEVSRPEDRFDEALGPHVRRWAYFHLLGDRTASLRLFDAQPGVPALERAAMRAAFPLVRGLMRRAMNIHAEGAERSRRHVDELFAEVSTRLADGRPYLVGDGPTAADLTFAALALPAVLPDHPVVRLRPLSALPPAAATQVEAWRATPAGRFATRMVREHR